MVRDFKGFYQIFRCDFYVLFGVIKNSEGLFSLFAEFLRGGGENRVGVVSLTHRPGGPKEEGVGSPEV